MDHDMIGQIKSLGDEAGKTCSAKIRNLLGTALEKLLPEIHSAGDANSAWKPVGITPVELRVSLDEKTYRLLKKIQADCNFFSIAQIVRLVLGFVMSLIATYGFEGFTRLFERKGYENARKQRCVFGSVLKMVHMDIKELKKTVYDKNFIPLWTEFS